jgi:hypothetical protein
VRSLPMRVNVDIAPGPDIFPREFPKMYLIEND